MKDIGFFSGNSKKQVKISPDGNYISYVGNLGDCENIYLSSIDNICEVHNITNFKKGSFLIYGWLYTNEHIWFMTDSDGNEKWNTYCMNISSRDVYCLNSNTKSQSKIIHISSKYPDKVLVGINDGRSAYFDLYIKDIISLEESLIFKNDQFFKFIIDDEFKIRFAVSSSKNGTSTIWKFNDNTFQFFMEIGAEDVFSTYPLLVNNNEIIMKDSRNRDTTALVGIDMDFLNKKIIWQNTKADIDDVILNLKDKSIEAISYFYMKRKWEIINKEVKADYDLIEKADEGQFQIVSKSLDNNIWLVLYENDVSPQKYYLYNRRNSKVSFLFFENEDLCNAKLYRMESYKIKSFDSQELVVYITTPNPKKQYPTILLIHGGPHARDRWGLKMRQQWLANKGYCVLSVNYRGSSGFGKKFSGMGKGRNMINIFKDLIAGVSWAVESGYSDINNIGVMGSSFGGYLALMSSIIYRDIFKCAICISGIINLTNTLKMFPGTMKFVSNIYSNYFNEYVEDKNSNDVSLINNINKIKIPLFIAHGKNDSRVNYDTVRELINNLEQQNKEFTHLLFEDEGHAISKLHNKIALYENLEKFLGNCLKESESNNPII